MRRGNSALAESADHVRDNLAAEPHLIPVFNNVGRSIKGNSTTRTERFQEWCAENPGEVWAMLARYADRDAAKMIRAHVKGDGGPSPRWIEPEPPAERRATPRDPVCPVEAPDTRPIHDLTLAHLVDWAMLTYPHER